MNNSSMCCTYETPMLDQYLPPVMFTEFALGLMGNVLALSMFFFHRDTWKPNSVYTSRTSRFGRLIGPFLPSFQGRLLPQGQGLGLRRRFLSCFTLSFGCQQSWRYILPHCSRRGPIPEDRPPYQPHQPDGSALCPVGLCWPVGSHHSHDCLPPNRWTFLLSKQPHAVWELQHLLWE